MKLVSTLTVAIISTVLVANGQIALKRELTPARGHYKQLSSYPVSPTSGGEAIDQLRFPHDPASTEKRLGLKPYYLQGLSLADFNVPDPPANSSEQTRAEINYLHRLASQRSTLDVESSQFMAGVFYNVRVTPEDATYGAYRKNLFHIGRSIGSWFNPETLPLTANLMASVWRDASYFIWSMKFKYLRVRPYTLDPSLPYLEDANWAAYPSGHAANSYINAYIYQELNPEFTDVFLKDAYDMAHSREILGVHYPSDSEASRVFARQFVNALFMNEKFLKEFEAVRKEWSEKAKETFDNPVTPNKTPAKKPASCATPAPECAKTN